MMNYGVVVKVIFFCEKMQFLNLVPKFLYLALLMLVLS